MQRRLLQSATAFLCATCVQDLQDKHSRDLEQGTTIRNQTHNALRVVKDRGYGNLEEARKLFFETR